MSSFKLLRPLVLGQGIEPLDLGYALDFLERVQAHKVGYFVPASGLASRMFGGVRQALKTQELHRLEPLWVQRAGLPFEHSALRTRQAYFEALLRYENTPKVLLPWHRTAQSTALCWQAHLSEFLSYFTYLPEQMHLHFTVSAPNKQALLESFAQKNKESPHKYQLSCSVQDPQTHKVLLDPHTHQPLLDAQNQPIRYPAGHGALLGNLQALAQQGTPLVFIKNIDNVPAQPHRLRYVQSVQQALGGRLLDLLGRTHQLLEDLERPFKTVGKTQKSTLSEAYELLRNTFYQQNLPTFNQDAPAQRDYLIAQLQRPIRVCGVLKTDVLAGGAPFLCATADQEGYTPQLVEYAEVQNTPNEGVFKQASYVNCAMLVSYLLDRHGKPLRLAAFVDHSRSFVTFKIYQGQEALVQELPGLWNGSMSKWNSCFVEIPETAFAPVKQVSDLLMPAHQTHSATT